MAEIITLMKQHILDIAIRGELVEQRENEGTAKVILDQIKKDKELLVKKEKSLTKIDITKLPYEIPVNWEWTKLGNIGLWGAGSTPLRSNPLFWKDGTIPWIKTGELNNSYIEDSAEYITKEALEKTSVKLNSPGDVLIAMYGATIGKLGILKIAATTNQACCACTPFKGVNNKFLFYYLLSNKQQFINNSEGGAQPNISKTKIINHLIPLPPFQEQERIVAKIESSFAIINKINEQKEESLLTIKNIRKTALQNAIQGLLVEQNESDEPASELIKNIKAEKEQLIKDKKIKKEKLLPDVEEYEIPFGIPESWEWVKYRTVINEIFGGGTPSKTNLDYWNGDVPWATVKDISDNDIYLNKTIDFITDEGYRNSSGKKVNIGDVIVITRMGLGRIVISNIVTSINQDLKGIKLSSYLDNKLFLYFYKGTKIEGTGTTVKGIKQEELLNTLIPLPPFSEQKRIVKKLDLIMNLCDKMEGILDGSTSNVTREDITN